MGAVFTMEQWTELPKNSKTAIKPEQDNRVRQIVQILNGDVAWSQYDGGEFRQESREQIRARQDGLYRDYLRLLYPILEQPERFDARLKGEVEIKNQTALWVRVASKGQSDIDLYFDKKDGTLVKMAHPVSNPQLGQFAETFFTDYKDFNGAKYPQKTEVWSGDKKLAELTLEELRQEKELPKRTFEKP
jgi:hypothetical protein